MDFLDHVGIAVLDLEKSISRYESDFGFKVELRESLPEQKIELAFLKLENTSLELLSASAPDSSISNFLSKRGEGLHHVCYRVKDINAELSRLAGLGYKLIDEKPRHGARNTLIAFVHPKNAQGVLTELCQKRA